MYGYIYKTTNTVNNKIYIGQKKSEIFLKESYLGSGKYLKNAIKKYGRQNFIVELLIECNSKEELDEQEQYWIAYYNSQDKNIGYNILAGGSGASGFDSGYHMGMLGKHQSDFQKQKVSKTSSYKRTLEQCKNMSIAQTGKIIQSKRIPVYCVELDRKFDSLTEACKFAKSSHVKQAIDGVRQHAGGYTWTYWKDKTNNSFGK